MMPPQRKADTAASSKTKSCEKRAAGDEKSNVEAPRLHKRSRSGCFTCRLRRKKCDEKHPACTACINLCVKCEYRRPIWWSNPEQRQLQKERIKNKIKQTKINERNMALADHRNRVIPLSSTYAAVDYDFNRPFLDPFASRVPTPALAQAPGEIPTYEVDIKTERQLFVNDVPTRVDTTYSSFSTFAPPQLPTTLPPQYFVDNGAADLPAFAPMPMQHNTENLSAGSFSLSKLDIQVDDCDRPLLTHFIDNVLRLTFPILEVHQRGYERTQAVLQSLETNKSYLHCCLSVAALHVKSTVGIEGDEIDRDILRHRYEAVSHLCQSLSEDTNHDMILEATLAMIFYHCFVGGPDEYLPDIAWNDHFMAATSLIGKLDLGYMTFTPPPFNVSLVSWIDILGSTMLGKSPYYAHLYRNKHLSGTSSGLRELMGCDDHVMYLISEISCLDALRAEGLVDDMAVCSHVAALGQQLEYTQATEPPVADPVTADGAIRADQLTTNITALFRIAARIYLCSLVPGFDRNQQSTRNLVDAFCKDWQYIPDGPMGYDRSLVWPLLITGAFSTPSSAFRNMLNARMVKMGDNADFGSFGRVYRLLQEVWRLSDDPVTPPSSSPNGVKREPMVSPQNGTPMRELKKQSVHWRDVMRRNGWKYLII